MPLRLGKRTEQVTIIDGFTCDKCMQIFDGDDIFSTQEMVKFGDIGGYGSAWGDGVKWSVVFCSPCAVEVLGEYAVIED